MSKLTSGNLEMTAYIQQNVCSTDYGVTIWNIQK